LESLGRAATAIPYRKGVKDQNSQPPKVSKSHTAAVLPRGLMAAKKREEATRKAVEICALPSLTKKPGKMIDYLRSSLCIEETVPDNTGLSGSSEEKGADSFSEQLSKEW